MKSNSLLTYVLYGLLGAFILAAGYYTCQRQKEQKEQAAREAAELDETLRDMGYASEDSITASGSSYTNRDSISKTSTPTKNNKSTVSKTGIENEASNPNTRTYSGNSQPTSTITKPKSSNTTKGVHAIQGPGSGRWAVRAGTFEYMEGARRRLEEVIKMGYTTAEISKTKEGKAAVIVFRSNSKDAAIRVVDQLRDKGIEAAVFAR